jgi:hypothetical protein
MKDAMSGLSLAADIHKPTAFFAGTGALNDLAPGVATPANLKPGEGQFYLQISSRALRDNSPQISHTDEEKQTPRSTTKALTSPSPASGGHPLTQVCRACGTTPPVAHQSG